MKTPEEIKESLRRCARFCHDIKNCEYNIIIPEAVAIDAITYIEQLEERIDLMLIQMRGDCGTCKHRSEDNGPCNSCVLDENRPAWEYDGLPDIGR